MEEDNKYYTSDIEDFHLGFEYQELYEGVWYDRTFWFGDVREEFDPINTRVKLLDKQDIEELGWIEDKERFKHPFLGKIEGYKISKDTTRFNEHNYRLLAKHPNSTIITIYAIYESSWGSGNEQLYSGDCPSKNELKKLMKMLNIK